MRLATAITTCCASLLAQTPEPPTDADGFLFVTFQNERTPMSEQIYFGTSRDGREWTALNNSKPVLVSPLGEKGVRDPFILRSHDGEKFYILATDLSIHLRNHDWRSATNAGSHSIVVWESPDLVNWSEPRLVKLSPDDAGCTWAPEAIYDEESGDYLIYWSSVNKRDNFAKHRVWAAHTKDFVTFSEPFVFVERDFPVIDTTIVRENGRYYRFTKNLHARKIFQDSADRLSGPWTSMDEFSLANTWGYEGPFCYPLSPATTDHPGEWCLLLDHYTKGEGYKAFVTKDIASGQFESAPAITFPFKFRHGAVLPLTADELTRVEDAYAHPRQ